MDSPFLPLAYRHLLAFARRYAADRPTTAAGIVAREIARCWTELPYWEQQKHQQELLDAAASAPDREAFLREWAPVLDLPLRDDNTEPMPAAVLEQIAQAQVLAEPPHIKRARAALAEAGGDSLAALDALTLAAAFYNSSTQVGINAKLKQDRDQTQDELERVSQQLLDERKFTAKLKLQVQEQGAVTNLRQELSSFYDNRANQKVALYMQHNGRLEASLASLEATLNHPNATPETKVKSIKKLVATALEQSTARKNRILAQKLESESETEVSPS